MNDGLAGETRALFATPPDEFVAARNDLVKRLRSDGDREAAKVVASFRRPSWPDHALNVSATSDGDEVAAFCDAAARTRSIQQHALDGRPTRSLADAMRELRSATAALATATEARLRAAGRSGELPAIRARLTAIAASETASDQLRRGVLGSEDEGTAWFAGETRPHDVASNAERPPSATRGRRRTRSDDSIGPGERATAQGETTAPRAETREQQRAAAEHAARAARTAERARSAHGRAERELEELRVALHAAEERLADTAEALAAAELAARDARATADQFDT